jgi:cation transport protein ChaC
VYIGLPENPQFLGPQDPEELARHILVSRGPSGENREYLYFLEKALLELSGESGDKHVSDLVRRCKRIEQEQAKDGEEEIEEEGSVEVSVEEGGGVPLHRVGSTEEQEEVEK